MASDAGTTRTARTEVAEDRRLVILGSATALIAERGFSGIRVADIARRAGVSPGLVIYYFGTLDALLTEALLHSESEFYRTIDTVLAQDHDPVEQVSTVVRLVLGEETSAQQARVLWLETWSQAVNHEAVAEARARQDRRWRQLFTDAGTAAGLTGDRARDFAAGFASLLDGLCIQVALGDADVTSARAVDIALAVLAQYLPSSPHPT